MTSLSLTELSELMGGMITEPLPHKRKVLLCAKDVVERLRDFSLSGLASFGSMLAWATSIDIVTTEDVPPGWYRLTEHDHCELKNAEAADPAKAWFDHSQCTVRAEGILA